MRKHMRKRDLKDGMIVKTRDDTMFLILNNKLMNRNTITFLDLSYYKKNLLFNNSVKDLDIMSVWATNSQVLGDLFKVSELRLIWEREVEIDWDRVPVDTPVYVRNNKWQSWKPKYFFKGHVGNKFLTWHRGCTSFASGKEFDGIDWKQCKLALKEDIEKYKL